MREIVTKVSCDKCGIHFLLVSPEQSKVDGELVDKGWKFCEKQDVCPVCAHSLLASVEWHKWAEGHKDDPGIQDSLMHQPESFFVEVDKR